MPMICEICGIVEEPTDFNNLNELLHVCANCMKDRQQPEILEYVE